MWQRFSSAAREAVFLATKKAEAEGTTDLSTKHMLLALLDDRSSLAGQALKQLGIDQGTVASVAKTLPVEQQAEETRFSGVWKRIFPSRDSLRLTPSFKRTIDLAYESARSTNDRYIASRHILLGLVRAHDSLGSRVLRHLHVDEDKIAELIAQLLARGFRDAEG